MNCIRHHLGAVFSLVNYKSSKGVFRSCYLHMTILTNSSVFGSFPCPPLRANSLVLKKLNPGQLATAGSDE